MNRKLLGILGPNGRLLKVGRDPQVIVRQAEQFADAQNARMLLAIDTVRAPSLPRGNATDLSPAEVALRAAKLHKIHKADVMSLSVEEAWRSIPRSVWPSAVRRYDDPVKTAMSLLGQNTKLKKSGVPGLRKCARGLTPVGSVGLSLAPFSSYAESVGQSGPSRPTLCAYSTPECRGACLVTTGHNVVFSTDAEGHTRAVRQGLGLPDPQRPDETYNFAIKYKRTRALLEHPAAFMRLLVHAIEMHKEEMVSQCLAPFIRLNVYSDIPWELFVPWMFPMFPEVQFYDYTKVPGRKPPKNYHLTYSYNGPHSKAWCERELAAGRNVAAVFFFEGKGHRMPSTFLGRPVIDGDLHDLRPLDELHPLAKRHGPVVVGLKFKPPISRVGRGGSRRQASEFGAFVVGVFEQDGVILAPALQRGELQSIEEPVAQGRGRRRNHHMAAGDCAVVVRGRLEGKHGRVQRVTQAGYLIQIAGRELFVRDAAVQHCRRHRKDRT